MDIFVTRLVTHKPQSASDKQIIMEKTIRKNATDSYVSPDIRVCEIMNEKGFCQSGSGEYSQRWSVTPWDLEEEI